MFYLHVARKFAKVFLKKKKFAKICNITSENGWDSFIMIIDQHFLSESNER